MQSGMSEFESALESLLAALAVRVAPRVGELLGDGHHDGFLNADGAAEYLGLTRKAIYAHVERGKLPHYRAGGCCLTALELRAWVERG
jgi:excisionase family DNA binding protein